MKIGEAWAKYSTTMSGLWDKKRELSKQQNELKDKVGKEDELKSVTLELNSVDEKYNKVQSYMEQLQTLKTGMHNAAVSRQQGEAMLEQAVDEAKCLETARRIAAGGKVPAKDIEKLMKYNFKLYMQSVESAALNAHKHHKKYKTLWPDEDKKTENENTDIDTEVDNMECSVEEPDLEE